MKLLVHALGLLLVLGTIVQGQTFGTGTLPPGSVFDDGTVHMSPLPGGTPAASTRGTLDMATLAGTVGPGDFLLLSAQSNRFGPYPYAQNAVVGSERFPYTLVVDSDKEFRLADPRKRVTMGPFRYETGTAITFDQAPLAVLRLPSQVIVTAPPRGKQSREPMLAMAPLTPAAIQSLVQLRTSLASLFNRLSGEVAARSMEGVPVVRGTYGFSRDAIVRPSVRDRENARRRAETTAAMLLESFLRDGMPLKGEYVGNQTYRFPALPPGSYIFCALGRVPERDALSTAPSTIEVWWTSFQIGAQEKIALPLTGENACGWAGIFKFAKLE